MNSRTEKVTLHGAAGTIEALRDAASPQADATRATPNERSSRGVVVIAHPHPLFGGTMDNKVVQTLARAFAACGWTALRFNFRGVGASQGEHDEGRGETDDFLSVVDQAAPDGALAIAGFSFGAFVASCALERLWHTRDIHQAVLVGTAATRFAVATLPLEAHARTLVIHGEQDVTVPLADVMDWARPQSLPVTVVPGCGHFFHGQLPLLKSLVARHLRAG